MPFITKLGAVAARAYGWLASVAQAVVSSDAYFYLVSMLLPGNGTNGQTNSTFLDSSTNNFSITRNGNTTQGTFSPLSQTGWGITFNRSYLSAALTGKAAGTGPFTYELFFFINVQDAAISNVAALFSTRSSGTGADGIDCQITSTGAVQIGTSGAILFTSATGVVSRGVWYHLAIVRTGSSNCLVFLDGVLLGTFTSSTNYSSTSIYLAIFGGLNDFLKGTISNFRYTRAAVYLTNFDPPSSPLTAISSTEFLTAQSNRYIDSSPNNFAITIVAANGSSSIQPFSPFTPSNFTTLSYSGWFDGTGDYLSIADNLALDMQSADFTIECWVILSTTPATAVSICGKRTNSATAEDGVSITFISNLFPVLLSSVNSTSWGVNITSTIPVQVSTWTHLAATRSGTTWTIWVNGVSGGTTTLAGTIPDNPSTFVIAAGASDGTQNFPGLISNFRVVKGTALYTANFTPPTAPLTAVSNTSLLTCQNATFIDNSTNAFTITVNGNAQPTTNNPFQTPSPNPISYSGYFDGSGDCLTVANSAVFTLGTQDHTVEFWMYMAGGQTANSTKWRYATAATQQATNDYYFSAGSTGGGSYQLLVGSSGAWGVNISAGATYYTNSLNTWVHVAWSRSGSTWRLFWNGQLVGTATYSGSIAAQASAMVIGAYSSAAAEPTTGFISNFRMVIGTAVYTAAFTPPTAPLTAISGTSLLTCQNNRFVDNSSNAFAITINGNTIPVTASPYGYETPISSTAYSGYFGSTANYLSVVLGAGQAFGTGNFTVECWLYTSATACNLLMPSVSTNSWGFLTFNNLLYWQWNGANLFNGGTVPLNTWVHVAVSRSSNSTSGYINGVRVFGGTANNDTNNYSATPTRYIGPGGGGSVPFSLSNVRVTKGVAVYTDNFTPPTNPLTADANTSLLTCQNFGRFIDNSPSALTVTSVGTPVTSSVNPFGYSTPATPTSVSYSALTNGGSGYFDGTGDYLTIPQSATNFISGTGDFTVEFWVYPISFTGPQYSCAIVNVGASGADDFLIRATPTASSATTVNVYGINSGGTAAFGATGVSTSTSALLARQWNHVAFTRESGVLNLWVNGVRLINNSTYTAQVLRTTATELNIGRAWAGTNPFWNGYISGLKWTLGSALYTQPSFAPPISPPTTAVSSGTNNLLLNYTNAGIVDVSSKSDFETLGTVQISTAQSKWGGSSIYFPGGAGNYVNISNAAVVMPSGAGTAFTLECWVYIISIGTAVTITRGSANNTIDFTIQATGIIKVDEVGVGNVCQSAAGAIAAGAWSHVALTRTTGNIYTIYVNGVSKATSAAYTASMGANVTLGYNAFNQGYNFYGYINDFRVSRFLRYTANFTPPTAAFPTQ